jgi:putative iron-regulated protein
MRRATAALLLCTALTTPAFAADPADVVATYADIAAAAYGDSLTTAQALQSAVATLIATPSESTLTAARSAWLAARVPYQQTEVFRFGNPIVDDWEGKVNAWPLDEGLIDYVATGYGLNEENTLSQLNIIATPPPSPRP